MRSAISLSALVALALVAAGVQDDPVKDELAKLQGSWVVIALTEDGKEVPLPLKELRLRLIITGDKYTTKTGDGTALLGQGRIEIDPTKKPKTIDQVSTAPADKGRTSHGIYQVMGDELHMCFAPDGAGPEMRPTAFERLSGKGAVERLCGRG
jgi:uncharacterized protein (TIGR03067 family)